MRTWYVVGGGEQMSYEEMIQIEEARVAEQKAWERLHEAIFKELFNKTDKQSIGSGIGCGAMNTQQLAHRASSQNDLLGVASSTTLLTEL